MDVTGDQTERHVPLATTLAPASPTPSSSQHRTPKSRPISRPSIDLELAGYKPEWGPSPLLADQATAHHVYRAIKQHESDRLKAHLDWSSQPEYIRIKNRQRESRRADKTREKLAALNAEAAQVFHAVEQASGVGPGKGRKLVPKPVYDNSAWQASPRDHPTRPAPMTGDQPGVAEAVQTRRGRRSYPSSIESVYASSTGSQTQTPELILLPLRTPSPPADGSASSSGSSSESENSFGVLRTPTMFEPRHFSSNICVRSNGSPPRPLVPQPGVVHEQWEGISGKLPAGLTKPTPVLRRSKRFP